MDIKLLIAKVVIELEVLLGVSAAVFSCTEELTTACILDSFTHPDHVQVVILASCLDTTSFSPATKSLASLATVILFPVTAVTTPEPPRADSGLVAPVPTTNPIVSNYSFVIVI